MKELMGYYFISVVFFYGYFSGEIPATKKHDPLWLSPFFSIVAFLMACVWPLVIAFIKGINFFINSKGRS